MSNVGRTLYGYCNGYFGRDSYNDKRIEAEGYDWIVAREDHGSPVLAIWDRPTGKQDDINRWGVPNNND